MDTLKPADVIIADFPGVTGVKRRPAVVISTVDYHTTNSLCYRSAVLVCPDIGAFEGAACMTGMT